MNEQQARERAEYLAKNKAYISSDPSVNIAFQDVYYEGYMAAWRDAQ